MADMHQKPEPPSESTAEVRTRSIEERLAYYAHLEESTYDAFIATDENLLVKAWNRGAVVKYGEVGVLAGYGQWDEMVRAISGGRLEEIDPYLCREVVRERFSVEAMLDGYEKAFEKILALRSGSRVGQKKLATRAAS
jgi:hypothetical protein